MYVAFACVAAVFASIGLLAGCAALSNNRERPRL